MKKKPRPEFVAWKRLVMIQIAAHEINITFLKSEIEATQALVDVLKKQVAQATKDEEQPWIQSMLDLGLRVEVVR